MSLALRVLGEEWDAEVTCGVGGGGGRGERRRGEGEGGGGERFTTEDKLRVAKLGVLQPRNRNPKTSPRYPSAQSDEPDAHTL